jgi:aminopeptidase N
LGLALTAAMVPVAQAQSPGSAGLGDPYYPRAGNGGYDVEHYELSLRIKPRQSRVVALATITATATQALSRFNLDYRGPRITGVGVDGQPVAFSRGRGELVITPAAAISSGAAFEVTVAYRGRPRTVRQADGYRVGWFRTPDGTLVASEPTGSPGWFPCNDHPTDKASFGFQLTVPRGTRAIANGVLQQVSRGPGTTTFAWDAPEPMATYLATVVTGRFIVKRSTAAGIPSLVALDPIEARYARPTLRRLPSILTLFAPAFGPYPFEVTGAIVDSVPSIGFALETQTRPVFPFAPQGWILAHEIAHQWFGDAVTLERWSDIWLHEGFATWAEWLWQGRSGGPGPAAMFRLFRRAPASYGFIWNPPPGRPGPKRLFATSVYVRGAMTLEALRQRIGDSTFRAIMRRWVSENLYGNASTADFIALAESQAGRPLDGLFRAWLYRRGKPRRW